MFRIYTPQQWFSLFRCAELIIEEDGLIYNADDEFKSFRQAIGKIDYASGFIYGEDYYKSWPIPVGKIVQDGDITKIYGEDYTSLSAWPILYIRGNSIYTADQFFKSFPMEAGYISGAFGASLGPTGTEEGNFSGGNYTNYTTSYSGDGSSGGTGSHGIVSVVFGGIFTTIGKIFSMGFWGIIGAIFGIVIVGAACYLPFSILGGSEGAEYAQMLFWSLAFGLFMSFFTTDGKDGGEIFSKMFLYSLLGIFGMDLYNSVQNGDLKTSDVVIALIFGVFIYGLVLVVPCAALSFIVWKIKNIGGNKKEKA